ncbi:MAG: signal recognition particle-docking protein FtsY [Verrucomicrobiota bacterium]|nr:signal recognition particle-docking protein FtsY [Verrucomicrobiota bacterium]
MLQFFKKLIRPFSKMRWAIGAKLRALFARPLDRATCDALEQLLYEADLGPKVTADLVEALRIHAKEHPDPAGFIPFLKTEIRALFPERKVSSLTSPPHVILVTGVNGSGKTTSIIKLAHRYQQEGKSVLLAAADTFRAAASQQLATWAERIQAPIIRSQTGSDPAAVVFDALNSAKTRKSDLLIIDTAGRLQNKTALMQELAKMRRVLTQQVPGAPHETLLILDATMGQNALDQARAFHQFTPITGIILTKLDGSAKGGIAVAIQKELGIPILWVGTGETMEDLIPFDPASYVDALFND